MSKITYEDSGVDYSLLDPFKIKAQEYARQTEGNIDHLSVLAPVRETRGESTFLLKLKDGGALAHVEEGLGTKNLIADIVGKKTGKSYYDAIAIDTIATIVNDLIQLGALPASIAMHLAIGHADWLKNTQRIEDLLRGWKEGCDRACAVWGGGETPILEGIIQRDACLLSGSAVGVIEDETQSISGNMVEGDRIVLLASNGVHTNGLSLCRRIAESAPEGYDIPLTDGRMFGEALLDPSCIYVRVMRDILCENVEVHYSSHITGHGFRKLMRHTGDFSYEVDALPPVPPVFDTIAERAELNTREMYETYNMGAGYAFFVPEKSVENIIQISKKYGIQAIDAGSVKKSAKKCVRITPLDIEYSSEELQLRVS